MKYNIIIMIVLAPLFILLGFFIHDNIRVEHSDKLVLKVAMWGPKEQEIDAVDVVNLKEFMEQHPNIEVKLEQLTGNIDAKIAASAAIGKMPDIFMFGPNTLRQYADDGFILDLLPFIESDKEADRVNLDDFFPLTIEAYKYRGKLYALPKDFTPLVMYYNKRVFDSSNVPYPPAGGWTWDQFLDTAKKLTRDLNNDGETDQFGFLIQYHPIFWAPLVTINGGLCNAPDGSKCTGYLDSPETLQALRLYTDLQRVHKVSPTTLQEQAMGQSLFETGRIGMMVSGHWQISLFLQSKAKEFSLETMGVTSLPTTRGKQANILGIAAWAISNQSRNKKEAFSLLKWITNERCIRRRAACHIAIMPRKSIAQEWASKHPWEPIFLEQTNFMKIPEFVHLTNWTVFERLTKKALEEVLLGKSTVQEAFAMAARRIDAKSSNR